MPVRHSPSRILPQSVVRVHVQFKHGAEVKSRSARRVVAWGMVPSLVGHHGLAADNPTGDLYRVGSLSFSGLGPHGMPFMRGVRK